MFSGMSLIFGEVWRVEDVLVFRKSTFFIINSCAFRFFFFDYARVEVTFRLFTDRGPCRLRQMKQNQDLINPGSVSGNSWTWRYPTLRPTLGLPDYNDVPLTLSPPRSIGLNLLIYASNTANILTISGRHQSRGKCHKTRTSTGSI